MYALPNSTYTLTTVYRRCVNIAGIIEIYWSFSRIYIVYVQDFLVAPSLERHATLPLSQATDRVSHTMDKFNRNLKHAI